MLQNLHVKNLALIDEVEITFDEHLNILTGETGAGKSVLIGSIESALEKKISKDMIRPGAKELQHPGISHVHIAADSAPYPPSGAGKYIDQVGRGTKAVGNVNPQLLLKVCHLPAAADNIPNLSCHS